jgi:hypothetical protein
MKLGAAEVFVLTASEGEGEGEASRIRRLEGCVVTGLSMICFTDSPTNEYRSNQKSYR